VHAAPPVRVSVGCSPIWLGAISALAGAAAFNAVSWGFAALEIAAIAVISSASALGAALAAGIVAWHRHAGGELVWDGAHWSWQGRAGQVAVALDLDTWMLLRFDGEGVRRWVALERRRVTGPWAALRAALYAVPPPAEPDAAPPA
jgi:hypothetical protein